MTKVYSKPKLLSDKVLHYCPGCTHGIAHKLVAQVIEEMGLMDKAIGIAPVGCAVLAYEYFNCDFVQAAHGRAPAIATAVKRVHPEAIVFSYQGDGDLASIGMAEIVHAASRGENITVIFINNAIFGMTGGQMAPTTLEGQKATTCQSGRNVGIAGNPIRMCELLSTLDGPTYVARASLTNLKNVLQAKKAIKTAFERQVQGRGFSIVELLSTCPTNWGLSPLNAMKFVDEKMTQVYPLGVFKDK